MKLLNKALRVIGHCDCLRFGVRDRIIRFFNNPDTCLPSRFKVDFYGNIYPGDLSTFIDWSAYYYGAYSKDEMELIGVVIEKLDTPVILDVGANIGHHALFMSGKAKAVHAFEPFPKVYAKIEEKIAVNGIRNITIYKVGLGDESKTMKYYAPESHNTGTGSFLTERSTAEALQLMIRRGDDVLAESGVGRVDFIKMDVEGFEPYALTGLAMTLKVHRPIVFFEWSQDGCKSELSDFRNFFPEDYRFYQQLPRRHHLIVFQGGWSLKELKNETPCSNILAVPSERAELLNGLPIC